MKIVAPIIAQLIIQRHIVSARSVEVPIRLELNFGSAFIAQHSSGPGLITLTGETLYFTPLTSSAPSSVIPLTKITGIKKKNPLKGLSISWNSGMNDGQSMEAKESFQWIGGRDELFARLISANGQRWVNV